MIVRESVQQAMCEIVDKTDSNRNTYSDCMIYSHNMVV